MKMTRLAGYLTAGALSVGGALAVATGTNLTPLMAQDSQQEVSVMMERGKVKSVLKNDHDDVDGLLLDSGLRIHFPPHMGERITAVVKVGDKVEVEGRQEVTPRGDKVFEITKLTSGKEMVEVDHPRPKPGSKGPRIEEPMNASGKVTEYAQNPHGDVDGLILKDGTVVKFPPHQSQELQKLVAIGDKVTIEGRRHVTPRGDVHLHADRIEAGGQTLEREGPKHGPKGPKHGPGAFEQDGPTNAELLRELKAIRQLLEKQVRS